MSSHPEPRSPDEPLAEDPVLAAAHAMVHADETLDPEDVAEARVELIAAAALAVTRPEPDLDAAVEAVKALQGLDVQVTRDQPSVAGPREPFTMPPAVITVLNGAGTLVVRDEVLAILATLRSTKPG